MASGETLTILAPASSHHHHHQQHEVWNQTAHHRPPFASEFTELCLDSYLSQYLFRIGIYGWRKRCLYFLVILLASLIVINLSLTIWIIKVLHFTIDGMGHLRIGRNEIRVEGSSSFLETLYAAEIRTRQEQPLNIESSRNITISTRNSHGQVTNRLYIGQGKLEVFSDHLKIRDPQGQVLLKVEDKEIVMSAQKMIVSGAGGVTFENSIQTSRVTADPTQKLRLESPTRHLRVSAPEGVGIESRAGGMTATCMKDFKLRSKEGSVILDSERLIFSKLRTVIPTRRGKPYPGIYEMCSCENGRLFLSPPDDHCQADLLICK